MYYYVFNVYNKRFARAFMLTHKLELALDKKPQREAQVAGARPLRSKRGKGDREKDETGAGRGVSFLNLSERALIGGFYRIIESY